jgi:hypothetical protein
VLVRVDLGPWVPARLGQALGPYAGVPFTLPVTLAPGRHELSCQAIDGAGHAQPFTPAPNVCGYGNHAVHRVRLTVR